ncbi:RusA family crossover junction endodeoxyribonuclease [Clostridium perfringens]
MKVVVTGKIRGKARPRVCRGYAFTTKDTVQYEKLVRYCYKEQDGRYLEGSIKALIIAYYIKYLSFIVIGKIILDSLNSIAYKDDSQVVELMVIKRYTEADERVEFELI